jgi:hypothetical protein
LTNLAIGLIIAISTVLLTIIAVLIIVLRGYIKEEKEEFENYKVRKITGREIEEIRRVLVTHGTNGLLRSNIMDLVYTIRAIQIGDYEDMDPYVPDDPYDGLEEQE